MSDFIRTYSKTTRFLGFSGLFIKEVMRFWRVIWQTVFAPVGTALLYLLIFSHVLEGRESSFAGIGYTDFLIPGLALMSMIQNGFANTSSSLIQSKVTGNIINIQLAPIAPHTIYFAYILAGTVRALLVGGMMMLILPFTAWGLNFVSVSWMLLFALLAGLQASSLGIIAGLWAEKFDQIALFQNFFILPFTFLAGVFYSIHSLPEQWLWFSRINPFFYLVDGFRYGVLGHSDVDIGISLLISILVTLAIGWWSYRLIKQGYKITS